jgi:ABC-type uncharacterized transport system substrate-binding protein
MPVNVDLLVKILKGADPGDLSVEFPTKLELVINLKPARLLNLDYQQRCSPAPIR